jgi:hypothetical protein
MNKYSSRAWSRTYEIVSTNFILQERRQLNAGGYLGCDMLESFNGKICEGQGLEKRSGTSAM